MKFFVSSVFSLISFEKVSAVFNRYLFSFKMILSKMDFYWSSFVQTQIAKANDARHEREDKSRKWEWKRNLNEKSLKTTRNEDRDRILINFIWQNNLHCNFFHVWERFSAQLSKSVHNSDEYQSNHFHVLPLHNTNLFINFFSCASRES